MKPIRWLFVLCALVLLGVSFHGCDCGTSRPPDGGPVDAGIPPPPDASAGMDAGGVDGGIVDSTITQIQNGAVGASTCVRVNAVVMSLTFADTDNTYIIPNDGGRIPKKGSFISEKNLTTALPRSGIEVIVDVDVATPTVAVGDDRTVVALYQEFSVFYDIPMSAALSVFMFALSSIAGGAYIWSMMKEESWRPR